MDKYRAKLSDKEVEWEGEKLKIRYSDGRESVLTPSLDAFLPDSAGGGARWYIYRDQNSIYIAYFMFPAPGGCTCKFGEIRLDNVDPVSAALKALDMALNERNMVPLEYVKEQKRTIKL